DRAGDRTDRGRRAGGGRRVHVLLARRARGRDLRLRRAAARGLSDRSARARGCGRTVAAARPDLGDRGRNPVWWICGGARGAAGRRPRHAGGRRRSRQGSGRRGHTGGPVPRQGGGELAARKLRFRAGFGYGASRGTRTGEARALLLGVFLSEWIGPRAAAPEASPPE